ncbi:dihydrodipicolinate synthase family protein [Pseudokineococcus sp. 5B2Z-1]|uniref:dihydrodipicolinate synthase family protein n=1 Tax=Pseudokineococcus sp. 5B2Z-1 TaxID=3132744 RepID=UPI0030AB5478
MTALATGALASGAPTNDTSTTGATAEPLGPRAGTGLVLRLPDASGALIEHELREPVRWTRPEGPAASRRAYAAAHVVPRALADNVPGAPADVDWDATLAYRHEIWSHGLGVADAMDTAQRGMGLDWAAVQELVRRSAAEAASVGGLVACGAGTDQLDLAALPSGRAGVRAVLDAYREQVDLVAGAGATVVLMASRALARVAEGPQDYLDVYGTLLDEAPAPVVLHWLGPMFDPALAGYWGSDDVATASDLVAGLIADRAAKVDGIKMSLLDAAPERALRARLPEGVRMYTGDDFNYPELVVGDEGGHSDALLGIFAAVYPAASEALQALDAGDDARALALLASTQELGRHVFAAPTSSYKTGIAFLSWVNGHQPAFAMVGGMHAARSLPHLARTLVLADEAGLLRDPALAAARARSLLAVAGVEA